MYKGLETGTRDMVSHAIKQNKIVFVFQSALTIDNKDHGNHLTYHGDGVKDIAFTVNNLELVMEKARAQGATIVKEIWSENDEYGTVRMACVQTVYVWDIWIQEVFLFNSTVIPLTLWLIDQTIKVIFYQTISHILSKTHFCQACNMRNIICMWHIKHCISL